MTRTNPLVLLVLGMFVTIHVLAGDAILVRDGQVDAKLVVTEELHAMEGPHAMRYDRRGNPLEPSDVDRAIAEIEEHLSLLGLRKMEVLRVPASKAAEAADGATAILLGGPELDRALYEKVLELSEDPEAFALRVAHGVVTVLGPTPKAVLNGVYELLEQLGFRWYMPGEFGRVIPKGGDTHGLREQLTVQSPSFTRRNRLLDLGGIAPNWSYRVRHSDIGRISVSHGTAPYRSRTGRQRAFDENPEFFSLRDGERKVGDLCVSNPDLLDAQEKYWREQFRENQDDHVLEVAPYDGYSYCECAECRALDAPGYMAALQYTRSFDRGVFQIPSMTDRYIWFINQLIDRLIDEFPDIKAPFGAYAGVQEPPARHIPDPRAEWHVAISDIYSCRIHGLGNPNCPESSYTAWLFKKWSELDVNMSTGGYHCNLSDPGFPFMMIGRFRDELPIFYEMGARRIGRSWHIAMWAAQGPSHYVAAKLAWDVRTDVDALLAEFFEKFYGPAAAPMAEYTMLMDQALYNADYHTGSAWDLLHIYDETVRQEARKALRRAEQLTGLRGGLLSRKQVPAHEVTGENHIYALRVEVAAKGWAFFEAFAEMIESRRRHDFATAMAALEQARDVMESLLEDYEIPMLDYRGIARRFLQVFFGQVVEDGYACLSDGGELIAGLDSQWDFMLDPQGIGERMNLHDPFYTGGNWQTLDTSHSWGTQGLRYYYGEAWYRQRVTIPDEAAGKQMKLWFSGVDSGARVWLNGELLGNSPRAGFDIAAFGGLTSPFEFDVTETIRPGEENVVVVRVIRDRTRELGSGGLRDVAMFYAPGDR